MVKIKILFASNNKEKLREVSMILNRNINDIKLVSLNELGINCDPVEDKDTLEGNAIKKAKEIYEEAGIPVISEDFGFFVEDYPKIAGVHSNRWYGNSDEERNLEVLRILKDDDNRKSYYKSVFCYYDGNDNIITEGILHGKISKEMRGNNGFAYDKIFELEDGRTIAELTDEDKSDISTRKIALDKMIDQLIDIEL